MPSRRSLDDTRALLLDTGVNMLQDNGVKIAVGTLSIIDVCRQAGLKTAGSAYKIWPRQDDFRIEVLRHALHASTDGDQIIEAITQDVTKSGEPWDLKEVIRVSGETNVTYNANSPQYRLYVALWCAAGQDPVLAEQIREGDGAVLKRFAEMYELVIELSGREWVPPYNADHLALVLSALVEGMVLRLRYDQDRVPTDLMRPTAADGSDEPWHLFACAVEAIVEGFTRPKTGRQG